MNWRRWLFRLWIVGSALFVFAVAVISYDDIKTQFAATSKRFEVQLEDGRTFEVRAPDLQTATAMVRALPEGSVPDKPLIFAPIPWATLEMWAAIAVGIPLAVLILGASLVWAFSGFAAKRP